MSMAKCKNTILSRSLQVNHQHHKRSSSSLNHHLMSNDSDSNGGGPGGASGGHQSHNNNNWTLNPYHSHKHGYHGNESTSHLNSGMDLSREDKLISNQNGVSSGNSNTNNDNNSSNNNNNGNSSKTHTGDNSSTASNGNSTGNTSGNGHENANSNDKSPINGHKSIELADHGHHVLHPAHHHPSSSSSSHHHHHHSHHQSSHTSSHHSSHHHHHGHHGHHGHTNSPVTAAHSHHSHQPQTAHHHSHHPTTHHHTSFGSSNSDPSPSSSNVKHHLVSASSSAIISNPNIANNDHHSSHHSTHSNLSHHHHHHNHHHSSHSAHHSHHLHNNYSIYGDSLMQERDLLTTSSSSNTSANQSSLVFRGHSDGRSGHQSPLSPDLGASTSNTGISMHNFHGGEHSASPSPVIPSGRNHIWNGIDGANERANDDAGPSMRTESDDGSPNLGPTTPQSIYEHSPLSGIDSSPSSILMPNLKKAKRQPQPIPDNCKDDAYWERRRRNNESAKRSRESRRIKEHQTHVKVKMLEHENFRLVAKVSILENEVEKLRKMAYDRREGGNHDNDGRNVTANGGQGSSTNDHKII